MGQVPAGREVEAHEGVARLQQREEHRLVGLGAGMRLHVGEAAAEQLLRALDGQGLGHVHELAAAVVAAAGIALGVLVGQHRALRFQHGAGDDVLRGDQLDAVLLAAELAADRGGELRVGSRRAEALKKRAGLDGGRAVSFMASGAPVSAARAWRRGGRAGRLRMAVARKARSASSATSGPIRRAPKAGDVGVVVRPGQPRLGGVVQHGGADAGMAVGGDRHADAGAADQHAEAGPAVLHRGADRVGEVRVVHARRCRGCRSRARVAGRRPAPAAGPASAAGRHGRSPGRWRLCGRCHGADYHAGGRPERRRPRLGVRGCSGAADPGRLPRHSVQAQTGGGAGTSRVERAPFEDPIRAPAGDQVLLAWNGMHSWRTSTPLASSAPIVAVVHCSCSASRASGARCRPSPTRSPSRCTGEHQPRRRARRFAVQGRRTRQHRPARAAEAPASPAAAARRPAGPSARPGRRAPQPRRRAASRRRRLPGQDGRRTFGAKPIGLHGRHRHGWRPPATSVDTVRPSRPRYALLQRRQGAGPVLQTTGVTKLGARRACRRTATRGVHGGIGKAKGEASSCRWRRAGPVGRAAASAIATAPHLRSPRRAMPRWCSHDALADQSMARNTRRASASRLSGAPAFRPAGARFVVEADRRRGYRASSRPERAARPQFRRRHRSGCASLPPPHPCPSTSRTIHGVSIAGDVSLFCLACRAIRSGAARRRPACRSAEPPGGRFAPRPRRGTTPPRAPRSHGTQRRTHDPADFQQPRDHRPARRQPPGRTRRPARSRCRSTRPPPSSSRTPATPRGCSGCRRWATSTPAS